MAPQPATRPERRTWRVIRKPLGLVMLVLMAAACADSSTTTLAPEPAATTPTETTSSVAPTTEAVVTTASAPTSTTTTLPPTTTTEPATAADDLAEFFAAAEELDAQIAAAADEFNAGFDPDAGTLTPGPADTIGALSAQRVVGLIPAGMDLDLETAVLAVYTDLESRIAALGGAAFNVDPETDPDLIVDLEYALDCLSNGSESKARFADDLAAARALAEESARQPYAAPDSVEAGILAARIQTIVSFNYGCASCGGAIYEEPIAVDWNGRSIADSTGFEAEFDGTQWQVTIFAC